MFNLTVELVSKDINKQFINAKELVKYLEYLCSKYICEVNVSCEVDLSNNKSFEMNCYTIKEGIRWIINCKSYDDTLKLVQGIFGLGIISFQNLEFTVMSLDMKEISEEEELNGKIINFVSA